MTYRIILGASLLALATFSQAASLCEQKEQSIQHEIDLAQKHDNQRRVTGLERALTETRATCSDASLRDARQEKIKQHQQKVAERAQELKQVADGDDQEKIAKREKKLAEAQHELNEVQAAPY
ncbi:periplasmic protein YqjC [Klebsiella pneumoniae]|nr:periplasmic protein YqjC [Klebsiella pneumoniae]